MLPAIYNSNIEKREQEKSPINVTPEFCQDQIDLIFASAHPLQKLHDVVVGVPYFLNHLHSLDLKNQLADPVKKDGAMAQLMYLGLPQLENILQDTKGLGVGEREMVSVGFEKLLETIYDWRPDQNHSEPDLQEKFRWNILTDTRRRVQKYIAKEYQINPARYELIPLYFQIREEYMQENGHPPQVSQWPEIDKMVNKYTQKLSEKGQEDFKVLRFVIAKPEGDGSCKRATKDMFQVIHEQASGSKIKKASLGGIGRVEDARDHDLLKAQLQDVMGILSDKEKQMITAYYGLGDGKKRNMSEIGEEIGTSKQHVKENIDSATRKMRNPPFAKRLRAFLDE